eukprot:CAMPEP_0204624192 /NCGR_PEP_ID=MMETSP0717-20131115/9949_1 /ASSEMBLY_ACC=CAM_ASM_000666 /TAXON_ID=230516 /ORGANISM="Chaetoceros curvisetus" /LENGTH=65 /DNA_ID=CAMNT_0051639507 /DNA_START=36 /DNA_END=233 /DNA_ORIENTATION=-
MDKDSSVRLFAARLSVTSLGVRHRRERVVWTSSGDGDDDFDDKGDTITDVDFDIFREYDLFPPCF